MTNAENLKSESVEIPPLNAMRAFETASRLGSVAAAAAELGVTPGAVSQQIRLLETVLGAKLFMRAGRGLALTAEGGAAAELLSEPFRGLREASRRLGRREDPALLRLGAPGPFAAAWLAPRLTDFEAQPGGFPIRLVCDPEPGALDRFQIDLEVRFSSGPTRDAHAVRLLTEAYDVLAPPAMIAGAASADWQDLVLTAPLVQCEEADRAGLDWRSWLVRRGLMRDDAHLGDRYNSLEQAVAGAAAGRGLVLGPRSIAGPAIDQGRLDVLVAAGVEPTGAGYDLVWPAGRGLRAQGRTLKTYLLDQSRPYETAGV